MRRGVLLQNQGRNEEAMRCYKTAIRCRPKLASAYLNLGQLYANSGDADSAADVWKKCAELDSNGLRDPKAHEVAATAAVFHLGRLYADTGRYFEAIESYQNAIRRRPVNYQPQGIYNMLGEAHAKLGHYEEAERWYKAALEAKPDHVPAHLKYGRMLAKNRSRLMEAELQFLKAKELAPEDTSVYFHFGHVGKEYFPAMGLLLARCSRDHEWPHPAAAGRQGLSLKPPEHFHFWGYGFPLLAGRSLLM
ncbi:unnamed protein product [Notodromas monacha]|uniref:Uncharacterized protein n=1 Tax=Notodromas monacha TaxID=399045 RepID=A0A7R9GD42_9CRUS|nr:unnamed protein product [Notodromas monacha]CAG0918308.1 unnamed protein product [Notodromas monacha]